MFNGNCFNAGSLEGSHLLELSKRVQSKGQLMDLGIKGLKLPGFKIQSALYDHKDSIQAASYEVIRHWSQQHANRHEAYATLLTGLKKAQMYQLAGEVQMWVEGKKEESSTSLREGK